MICIDEMEIETNGNELKYSENAKKLKELLKSIEINVDIIGSIKSKWDENLNSLHLKVKIKRYGYEINFDFFGSHIDSELYKNSLNNFSLSKEVIKGRKAFKAGLMYSLLCCIALEGSSLFEDFEDFCDEFGYSIDSIKDRELYFDCCKQRKIVKRIFTIDELELLPN